jgi:bifunctional non-homologous end joining protein LigD
MILKQTKQDEIVPIQTEFPREFQTEVNERPDDPQTALAAYDCAALVQPFVVKKHRASRLHYDFRLQWNGVLKSWAIRNGPSYCEGVPCEAVEVEDHRKENIAFEGVFPEGTPGAGPTIPWDLGFWMPLPGFQDVEGSSRKGCLEFTLHGKKLKGNWRLVRRAGRRGRRPIWDLIKLPDAFARSKDAPAIVDEKPNSVLSGKSLEEVEHEWTAGKKEHDQEPRLF